jgi:hypothetical protein
MKDDDSNMCAKVKKSRRHVLGVIPWSGALVADSLGKEHYVPAEIGP